MSRKELQLAHDMKIWELFAEKELQPYQISRELKIPIATVEECIERGFKTNRGALGDMVEQRRQADLERYAALISIHSENALQKCLKITKTDKEGFPFIVEDYETPLKSAKLVMEAMAQRQKILGYEAPEGKATDSLNIWLTPHAPAGVPVKELKDAKAPIDIGDLELVCEAEN